MKIVFACAIFGVLCLGLVSVVSRSSVGGAGENGGGDNNELAN